MARLALVAGLFLAPLVLAWLGHRFRDRSRRQKGAFWGGLFGHTAGLLLALGLALAPPIVWSGGAAWRDAAVHYAMIVGFALGTAIGAMLGRGDDGPPAEVGAIRGRAGTHSQAPAPEP
jgi:hypothetical protein